MNSRSHGNVEDCYCSASRHFHLWRCLRGTFTRVPELLSLRDIFPESPTKRIFLTRSPNIMDHIHRYLTKAVVISINPNRLHPEFSKNKIRQGFWVRGDELWFKSTYCESYPGKDIWYVRKTISHLHSTTGPYLNSRTIVRRFLLISLKLHSIMGEVTICHRWKKLNR